MLGHHTRSWCCQRHHEYVGRALCTAYFARLQCWSLSVSLYACTVSNDMWIVWIQPESCFTFSIITKTKWVFTFIKNRQHNVLVDCVQCSAGQVPGWCISACHNLSFFIFINLVCSTHPMSHCRKCIGTASCHVHCLAFSQCQIIYIALCVQLLVCCACYVCVYTICAACLFCSAW